MKKTFFLLAVVTFTNNIVTDWSVTDEINRSQNFEHVRTEELSGALVVYDQLELSKEEKIKRTKVYTDLYGLVRTNYVYEQKGRFAVFAHIIAPDFNGIVRYYEQGKLVGTEYIEERDFDKKLAAMMSKFKRVEKRLTDESQEQQERSEDEDLEKRSDTVE